MSSKSRILLLHNIRSVHNMGALFRTADAIGINEIVISGYSPSPVDRFGRDRNDFAKCALGAEKSVPWEHVETPHAKLAELKSAGFTVVGVEQDARSVDYKSVAHAEKMVFVMGTETTGIDIDILSLCDVVAEIPMRGTKESLNVSVAAGIVLYRILDKELDRL